MAGSTLNTPPASEPVTVEEARSQSRLSGCSDDGLVAGYLLAARVLAEERTGRVLTTQTWTTTFDQYWPRMGHVDRHLGIWPRRRILLERPPLQSVVSITYVDTTGATQTLDPSQYQVGAYKKLGAIEEAYSCTWPAVRCQMDAISVQYTAGYAGNIPETIRQAILLLAGHFYENRSATVISATRMSVSELPIGIDALLAKHWVPWGF